MRRIYKSSIFVLTFSLLFLVACTASDRPASPNSIAFYAHLSVKNENHKLYPVGDKDAPHPFYKEMANEPQYPYEDACGFGAFLYDPERGELHFSISYAGLSGSPIMMHFHLGGPDDDGPIIQTIFGEPYTRVQNLGSSTRPPIYGKVGPKGRAGFVSGVYKIDGNPELTPPLSTEAEKEKLFKGLIYVNIHTYLNEAGEIRGQVLPCSP